MARWGGSTSELALNVRGASADPRGAFPGPFDQTRSATSPTRPSRRSSSSLPSSATTTLKTSSLDSTPSLILLSMVRRHCRPAPSALADSPAPPTARICSPLTVLRSLLLYIRGHIADPTFTENLRATLAPVELPALPEPSQHFVGKVEVTASFVDRLFGETMIEQLRCREAIARFMLVSC